MPPDSQVWPECSLLRHFPWTCDPLAMPDDLRIAFDRPCDRCEGTRLIPLTFGDRQTGYDQPGFKCPDCGARFLTLRNQRLPRPI